MIKRLFASVLLAALNLLAACADGGDGAPRDVADEPSRPNILLIVVDDMGYADLGSFGSEIATPNLDRLAFEGVRFSNFHASTMCSPSRAMLLTGVDSHRAGFGNMFEERSPNQEGKPGYEGYLTDRVVTLPTLLKDAGYRTYMTGKWHLGAGDGKGPSFRGFDRSFTLESGGASHFGDMRPAYAPSPEIKAKYSEDGVALQSLPDTFEYSTQYYVDRMIDYIDAHDATAAPFFAYLAFTAPHWPLQAPDAAIANQRSRYDAGYDAVAEQRLQKMKALGLVPKDAVRNGRSPKERPWDELGPEARQSSIRAMEIYAAMMAEVDRHTGRLLAHLDASGLAENTVILFMSDNGPEGHDLDETWPMESFPDIRRTIDASHDFSYEAMGRPGSYVLYGPDWANAGSPAFRLYKAFPTEGGSRVAAFMHHPGAGRSPGIVDDFIYVTDVVPTVLEIAGVEHPGSDYRGRDIEPLVGESFLPLIEGSRSGQDARVLGMELLGKRSVRKGSFKLVHMPPPYGNGEWQLYNLDDDLAESVDVANQYPEIAAELLAHWETYAKENNVIIPDWVSGY